MNILKMKKDVEEVIDEMIEEYKETTPKSYDEYVSSYDDIVKFYLKTANYLDRFAETKEEEEIIRLMKHLNFVRCFGYVHHDDTTD